MFTKELYQEVLEWLYTQVPDFQNIGNQAYKPGFENILKLCSILGNPQTQFKSIHIAGTNGKGSTSNMVASILKESNYKVGLFTSPHLKNFSERIRVNGEECSQEFIYNFLINIKNYFSPNFNPSFFELTTAMAFSYFSEQKVDLAVIEVGLGGRLDSTNIITPEVCAITSISLDHTDLLGNTLEEIAFEKAGIIKTNIPVVIGEEKKEIKQLLINIAQERQADYIDATLISKKYTTDLTGIYQKQNMRTALGVISILKQKKFNISDEQITKGLLHTRKNMNFRGRWEILQKENPMIICDTAHNEGGFRQLSFQFKKLEYTHLRMVLGFVRGKNLEKIFPYLPPHAIYYFVQPNVERGMQPYEYEDIIKKYLKEYKLFHSVEEGINASKSDSCESDIIFIGGSNFVISEIL